MTKSTDLSIELNTVHRDIIRTIERFLSYGLEDEIVLGKFTNKMNRTYPMYYISDRVVNMIEAVYLFSGVKESELSVENKLPKNEVVYFITDGVNIKIGYTTNLINRLAALQVGNPKFIEVMVIIENANKKVESIFHKMFKEHHLSGEWFSLNYSIIPQIREKYINAIIYSTLDTLLFELWHLSPDGTEELKVSDFIETENYRIKRKLKVVLEKYINEGLSYELIYKYAKEEVNKLADSLNFKKSLT